ncbi:hypothetical protein C0J52_08588, partial [Blattella germanica]
ETLGPNGPQTSSGHHNHLHHTRLVKYECGCEWCLCLMCSCCLGGGPGIELITYPGRPSMSLCSQKRMYVIHSKMDNSLSHAATAALREQKKKKMKKKKGIKAVLTEILFIENI